MKFNLRRPRNTDDLSPYNDFGLGNKVGREPGTRLINDDGSFNIVRKGRSGWDPFQQLIQMPWWRLLLTTITLYVLINIVFAAGFLLIGTDSLSDIEQNWPWWQRALGAYFFSVQTFTTVGYGGMAPVGIAANALASLVALFGWIALAILTGVFYGRFARPGSVVLFSDHAVVATYRGTVRSLQIRIVNRRDTNLINVHADVVITWLEQGTRRFAPLPLERDYVPLFPLNWTIVHPIDENSPLRDWTYHDFRRHRAEILITVNGYDQVFAQAIHARNSYLDSEIEWGARFKPMYTERERTTEIYLDRLSAFEEE